MLLITRRTEEALYIGTTRVVVLHVRPGRVTLGIDAPAGTAIVREELLEAQYDEATKPTPLRRTS